MRNIMILAIFLCGLKTFAVTRAPISGECELDGEVVKLEFPSGNGSLYPKFKSGAALAVFAGPSENLAKDEKGLNLFDVTIDAQTKEGHANGTTILRHLTANPKLQREIAVDLLDGSVLNCKF